MSSRWEPPLALPIASEVGVPSADRPFLPAPTVVNGPAREDSLLTYGMVARVALSQPGFGFRMEHDLPQGVDLVEARPRAKVVGDHLIWQFGRVDPGQQIRLEVVVRPNPERC